MRIVFYIIMGVVNSIIGMSIFVNKNLWNFIQVKQFLSIEGFASFLPQFLMPIISILFAYYCFSIKAREDKIFWKINFVSNIVMFILFSAAVIVAQIGFMGGAEGAASSLLLFSPFAIISTLNLRLLFYRFPVKNGDKNDDTKID